MKKTISRILSSIFVLVVLLLSSGIQKVYGVGIVHQAWVQEDGPTSSYVLFRTYTTPHPSSERKYDKSVKRETVTGTATADASFWNKTLGKEQISKWVYKEDNEARFDGLPEHGQFQTYELIFHGQDTIGNYTAGTDYGYSRFNPASAAVGKELNTSLYNSATRVDKNVGSDTGLTDDEIAYNTSGSIANSNPKVETDPWFRMTLVAATSTPKKNKDRPIYITDRKLETSTVETITNSADTKKMFFPYSGYQKCLRVTNVLVSKAYPGSPYDIRGNGYDRLDTPHKFYTQGAGWSSEAEGRTTNGLDSALNLYDNILVFPETAVRTLVIKHVNIGLNETINTANVEDARKSGDNTRYREEIVKLNDDGQPVDATEEAKLNKLDAFGEQYIGYNVANTNTKSNSEVAIDSKVSAHTVDSTQTKYTVPVFTKMQDEVIVVEMYYREIPREFKEVHMYFDEAGNLQESLTAEIVHKKDDLGDPVTDGSNKTVHKVEAATGYSYIGAQALGNKAAAPTTTAGFDKTKDHLTLNYSDNDSTDKSIGYFAYQLATNVTERHILYTSGTGNAADMVEPKVHIITTGSKTLSKITTSAEYLGVVPGDATIPGAGSYTDSSVTQYTATSADNYVYFGYLQETADIHVREILFDADGELKQILHQYQMPGVTTDQNVILDSGRASTYSSKGYEYRGYIKTNSDNDPTLGAYVESTSCYIEFKEIVRGEVYVNFLFQETPKEVNLAPPNINAQGKLDFDITDSSQKSSTTCESAVYTRSKWGDILSVPIGAKLKFGIIGEPKYFLGAVEVEKEEKRNRHAMGGIIEPDKKTSIKLVTNVTAHGPHSNQQFATVNLYYFSFPWKYSEYRIDPVKDVKLYKLSESYVFQPGFSNYEKDGVTYFPNTSGQKVLSDTEVYKAVYDISNISIDFKKGLDPQLTMLDDFDYYLYMNPVFKTTCPDSDADGNNGYSAECSSMNNFTVTEHTGVKISTLFTSLIGFSDVSADHTIIEEVHVYASYDKKTHLMGETGIFKYYDEDVDCKGLTDEQCADNKRHYIVIENEETVLNWFLEAINDLIKIFFDVINAFYQWITENPDAILYDYTEIYDETKENNVLRKLAQNTHYYLNGNEGLDGDMEARRDVLYTLYFKLFADKSILQIDGNTIAQNKGINDLIVKIDSSNMQEASANTITGALGEGASFITATYEQKDYAFPGVIDYSQTGVMRINELGKSYYTDGFNPVNSLDEEKNIRQGTKENFVDTVGDLATKLYRYNGLRFFAGRIKYEIDDGTGTDLVRDNLYYSDKVKGGTLYVFNPSLRRKEYNEDINKETKIVKKDALGRVTTEPSIEILNVYTPIEVYASDHLSSPADVDEPESQLVDEFGKSGLAGTYVVLESGFQLDIGIDSYSVAHKYDTITALDMKKYLKGFYLKFDFAVEKLGKSYSSPTGDPLVDRTGIKVNGAEYKGGSIPSNTWIYIPAELLDSGATTMTIRAKAKSAIKRNVTYTVRAVAKNILDLEGISKTSSLASFYETYQNICNDQYPYGPKPPVSEDAEGNPIPTDSSPVYYDEIKVNTGAKAIERLYDFRITDVKDVDWKNVFRNGTEHNGKAYYVGMRRWSIGEEAKPRTEYEVGSNPSRLLPIGPKKHTDLTYKEAPKLGYRFSFDVKLTGEYDPDKKVIIDVDFRYISKDGTTSKENIELYYKNKAGNYVRVGSAQDNYELTFIPNDGYRLLEASEESHLSSKSVRLYEDVSTYEVLIPNVSNTDFIETSMGGATDLTRLVLNASTMSTVEENVMTLYGEYKLPNSTVAIDPTAGGNIKDSKTYLKNGYIAVEFDIKYHHDRTNGWSMISYSSPMKKEKIVGVEYKQGTSQWEYEGYLGFNYKNNSPKRGNFALDKGMYQMQSSSTVSTNFAPIVCLFDLDARAATDFN